MITLQNVVKDYTTRKNKVRAVDDVSLEIAEGEIFGVIGYSGAGKSSLIRLFNGLELPTTGQVDVNGKMVSQIRGRELRKARQKIGMIFQHFNLLWSRTVYDNIAFPLEIAGVRGQKRKERVNELIRLVGLEGKENSYPSELSGGQKQRVGIARALANNPTVLLCDEATSALDPQTTDEVLELLLDINKRLNLTIIVITHEMHVIRKICNRVAVMEAGKVVEIGDVLEVFKHPKQPVTKRFIEQVTESDETEELIHLLLENYSEGKLVKLLFMSENATRPVISEVAKEHDVSLNVLHGSLTQTQNGAYGTLYVQIEGSETEITQTIQHLRDLKIETEVIEG
ncbi:D-methionine ABC transporter ATP-binding protein [Listeria fleischmannii 1991]|uniref:Methionine import ATP-binding protein MetN n=2 Tax=Listeria fleischmannii TaxID=1069827 RepID=A0A2X3GV79_9LIST|nr:methionine ABC transporter ATP-binding protein [Listeria fleischmannii]EMG26881.1 methionine import ATP-binding protein metN 2 [Listeria fleischmannii subsp. fleischmannii LU2006-1]KMT59177.1 D-methionine ABC transporter ATP-binding protein [Listeria fleischmannii 1991]SQC72182.1 Methionine import ATP-binding protein MetN [Listeria fleischmannii subsp. fleischmannii]